MTSRQKMATIQLFFQSRVQVVVRWHQIGRIRGGDQDTGSPGRPVSSVLQVPGLPGNCRARTKQTWWNLRKVYPSKYPTIAAAEMSNTPLWESGPLEFAPLTFLICIQVFQDPLPQELPHVLFFMNYETNPLTWDAQLLSYWFNRNPAVSQD